MDRLTERFSNGQAASYWCGSNCKYNHKYCIENVENCPALGAIFEKLCHYEEQEDAACPFENLSVSLSIYSAPCVVPCFP